MAQQTQMYAILSAPSKFDLMSALFQGRNNEDQSQVKFTIQKRLGSTTKLYGVPMIVEVMINGVSREDGSGESWCIHGYVKSPGMPSTRFKGWFRTSDRHGWMEF